MERQRPLGVARPRPAALNARAKDQKRFTVRDGFHLKDRNDEKRVEIDHAIASDDPVAFPSSSTLPLNQTDDHVGPTAGDVVNHRASCVDTEIAMVFDFLHRPAPLLTDAAVATVPLGSEQDGEAYNAPGLAANEPVVSLASSYRQAGATVILSRLGPSADWLVYRHRSNDTPRRKEHQLEQMIAEVLDPKANETLRPTVPDCNAATNRCRNDRRHRHRGRRLASPAEAAGYATSTSIGLAIAADALRKAGTRVTPRREYPAVRALSTQRSLLREKTAVPLKTDKLLGRLDEFRSFPGVAERVLQQQCDKRQEIVDQHGEDLVAKNRRHHRLIPPLQRPPHTPVFPSIVEHKQQQALRRKQLVDETQEISLRSVVNRWQNRREEIRQQERHHYAQSQWILITYLGQATAKWMKQFTACKARRDLIFRLAMIKKIQRYWKQRRFLRKNAQAALAMPADSPLRSHYFRMPSVLKAILVLQSGMRKWLARKRARQNKRSVEIIVTSWLEFQDVKFRRLILRFRKRVREFQTRWRTWRAITDARIKLLLLVWARVEKKQKRRGGMTTVSGEADGNDLSRPSSPHRNQPRTSTGETIHRHLRNGGMVLTAMSALSSTHKEGKTSPGKRAKPELDLRHHVEEDLQFAMRDFFTTSGRSPTSKTSPVHHKSTSTLPSHHNSHHLPSGSVVKNRSTATIPPWRPPPQPHTEKIPHSLKVSLLRQLLSEKRKKFQATKDRKRIEWRHKRQQLRRIDFRYNVLEELAAVQRFEAEHAVFLMLRSISENEISHLIQQAQQRLSVSTNPHSPFDLPPPVLATTASPSSRSITPTAPGSAKSRYEGPRRSTLLTIRPRASVERQQETAPALETRKT